MCACARAAACALPSRDGQALVEEFSAQELRCRDYFSLVRALLVRTRWDVALECASKVQGGEMDAVGRTGDVSVSASWKRICVILAAAQEASYGACVRVDQRRPLPALCVHGYG